MNEYQAAQLLCLLCSAHFIGAIAAIPVIWLGQPNGRIVLAYGLGASLPISVAIVTEASEFPKPEKKQ